MRLRTAILTLAVAAATWVSPAVAAVQPAAPADTFVDSVGVNTHLMHTDSPYWHFDAARNALRTLGVAHIRDGIRGFRSEAARWYYDAQAARLTTLAGDGIGHSLILPGPDGATGTTGQALDAAARIPGIESFEAANEWDLNGMPYSWSNEIRAHTRQAYGQLRADPRFRTTPLIGPSFGRPGSPQTVGDLSADLDFGNAHPYTNGTRPELPENPGQWSLQRNIDALRLVSGTKPFVFTESGYNNATNGSPGQQAVPEDVAAVYTTRAVLEHFRAGATRTYLYELADSSNDPARVHQEANWGLFRADWSPKPAATAVANLLALLRDGAPAPRNATLDYTVTGGDADLRVLAFARAGGGFTLALWRAESVWNHTTDRPVAVPELPVTLTLARAFAVARTYRPLQGRAPASEQADAVAVRVGVGASPVLVDLRTDTAAPPPPPEPQPRPLSTAGRLNTALRNFWCQLTGDFCRRITRSW